MLLGPTASGKTRLAAEVAAHLSTGIISADSRQVYRHLNLGTGKDYDDYVVNGKTVPYHLIDIVEPTEEYHIHRFQQDAKTIMIQYAEQQKIPIICGGSGMYIDALLRNYSFTSIPVNQQLRENLIHLSKPELIEKVKQFAPNSFSPLIDFDSHKRLLRAIEINTFLEENPDFEFNSTQLKAAIVGLNPSRELRRERIANRLKIRLECGLIEEVEVLRKRGLSDERLIYLGLEYKFITEYLQGKFDKNYLIEHLTIAIQQFAKRQMTWFRKMEKDGHKINWIDLPMNEGEAVQLILNHYKSSLQVN